MTDEEITQLVRTLREAARIAPSLGQGDGSLHAAAAETIATLRHDLANARAAATMGAACDEDARADERADVVAWLRMQNGAENLETADYWADAIERREYLARKDAAEADEIVRREGWAADTKPPPRPQADHEQATDRTRDFEEGADDK